jgi:hypothetical protein
VVSDAESDSSSSPKGFESESLSDVDAAAARPSSVSDGIDEISEASEDDAESCESSLADSEVSIFAPQDRR